MTTSTALYAKSSRIVSFLLFFVLCSVMLVADEGHGRGRGHGNNHHGDDDEDEHHFRSHDRVVIINNYQARRLPPGLQKKLYRSGYLPRGWERDYRPFPVYVERELPPLPYGCQRGYYGGYAVVVDPKTRLIIDVMDVISEMRRR
jgi:hypothetical protein